MKVSNKQIISHGQFFVYGIAGVILTALLWGVSSYVKLGWEPQLEKLILVFLAFAGHSYLHLVQGEE
jgi:hypothetical protein